MIDKREILEAASSFSLLPNTVEKDYVLGWILAGINAHEELSESWVWSAKIQNAAFLEPSITRCTLLKSAIVTRTGPENDYQFGTT